MPRPAVLDRDRPVLVVAPAAADLQVPTREALLAEPAAADERDRAVVLRLDVRLDAMEPEIFERVPQDQLEPLAHVAFAGERLERVVAEVGVAEVAVEDLPEPEVPDDRVVLVATDHEPDV